MNRPIPIGADGRCKCNCGTPCPIGRTGTEYRCRTKDLTAAGIEVVTDTHPRQPDQGTPVNDGNKPKFLNDQFRLVLGQVLIDVEFNADGDCDCGPQYTLHFVNGQQIEIYVHPDTGLTMEED